MQKEMVVTCNKDEREDGEGKQGGHSIGDPYIVTTTTEWERNEGKRCYNVLVCKIL